jgi:NAD(P)-dependent dehydrogenase (short-subunit alcohol dehydrogenase family)
MRLKNKSALITGGTSGIGLATAKLFIAEGARVAVTGRDVAVFERVKAELGDDALVFRADVRSIDDMRAVAAELKERFGGLDVVFANAGWAFPSAVNDIDDDLYNEIMDINVKGVVYTLQAMLPELREGASVILNTSFVAQTGKHGISLTAAAKAAVRSLARSWSYEFLDRKIRFNAIAPGGTDTPCSASGGCRTRTSATSKASSRRPSRLAVWQRQRTLPTQRSISPATNPPTWSAANWLSMAAPRSFKRSTPVHEPGTTFRFIHT